MLRTPFVRRVFTTPTSRKVTDFFDASRSATGDVAQVGRAWRIAELRGKSFDELHGLWHVLLKERNMLETERVHLRNPQLAQQHIDRPDRIRKVRLSMARLRKVLDERSQVHKQLCQVERDWLKARGLTKE